MALLEGHNLRKTYNRGKRNHVDALRGVDVAIEAGEMVAIMGPSGSGKSTLMHILGLLHGPDVNDGPRPELRFDGREVVDLRDRERTSIRAREMGFVFQEFNLVPTLTALENVLLACTYAGVNGGTGKTAAMAALAGVDLADRAGHRPAELSGGEQQRVAVARALANTPAVVLADEPSGNLDTHTSEQLHDLFFGLRAEHGVAMVLVTHNRELADRTDRILQLKDGLLHQVDAA
jgi:ABC-type lipoprotein export system ATPase subunit